MAKRLIARFTLSLTLFLIPAFLWAAPPSRIYTYTSGSTISPSEVTSNEDAIFNYLSRGVDTFAGKIDTDNILDGTIVNADISGTAAITYGKLSFSNNIVAGDIAEGAVGSSELASTAITAGTYNIVTGLIVDADGRITSILDGTIPLSVANGGTGYANDNRFKMGTFTRDTATASGDVSYTGVGFTPAAIFFDGNHSYGMFVGRDDGTNHASSIVYGTTPLYSGGTSGSILIYDGTNQYDGYIKSFDSDGFTITWVKTVSPTGTATIRYLAIR